MRGLIIITMLLILSLLIGDCSACTLFSDCQVGSTDCKSCKMVCLKKNNGNGNSNGYCFPNLPFIETGRIDIG